MRFDSGINDQGPTASPMFVLGETVHTVNIMAFARPDQALGTRTATDIGIGSMSGVGIVTGSSVTFAPQPAMSTVESTPPMRLRKFALNSKFPAVVHAHEHLFRVAAWSRVPSIATGTRLGLL